MQTVHYSHTPEAAGMILAVKELVEVGNVSASAVRTVGQQRVEEGDAGMLWLGRRSGLGEWFVWAA